MEPISPSGHLVNLPVLNLMETRRFIDLVYPRSVTGMLHIASTGDFTGRQFARSEVTELLEYVRSIDALGCPSIYLRTTTDKAGLRAGSRGQATDAAEIPGLWADIDFGAAGHSDRKDLPRPPDETSAAHIVTLSGLPAPTLWVHSGGGLYPWWLLYEPFSVTPETQDYLATLAKRWNYVLAAAARSQGWFYGTEASDLARVLRLPGSVNRKVGGRPRPCHIVASQGPRYLLQDLHAAVEAAAQRWGVNVTATANPRIGSTQTQGFFAALTEPDGTPCKFMRTVVDRWIATIAAAGPSCHDEGLKAALAVAMEAAKRHRGALTAMEAVQTAWLSIRQPGATTGQVIESAEAEWSRLEQGAWNRAATWSARLTEQDEALQSFCHCDDGSASPFVESPPVGMTADGKPASGRKLPLIPDHVWERRSWLRAIRDRARGTSDSPDGVLGSALGIYAASLPHNVKIVTGMRRPIGFSLLVGLVSKSGRGKSAAWGLACDDFAPIDHAPLYPVPTGEGITEKLMGWETKIDPMTGKDVKVRVQVSHNAVFHIDEGEALNAGMMRDGTSIGATLRAMFSDQQLGNANANIERERNIPRGMYSLALVVGYQPSTAMRIVHDTSTGMAQRFLWFSARRQPTEAPGVESVARFCLPHVTALQQATAADGKQQYLLPVAPDVADLIKHESDARDSADDDDAEDDLDSQRPVVLAKLAGLGCLIEGRTVITMDDWQLAADLYAASCAVRDALIELDEERGSVERRQRAALMGEADEIRKGYREEVIKVANTIMRRVVKLDRPVAGREITHAIASKDRVFLREALDMAIRFQKLVEVDGKFELGPLANE